MIWIDGRTSDTAIVPFDLGDRGLLLADGLFETILVVGGVPFRVDQHLARLAAGAATLRLPDRTEMAQQAIHDLARHYPDAGVVRVTLTRGAGARGLALPADPQPVLFATAAPWSPGLAFPTLRLATASIRRNASSPLSSLKTLSYLDNILALEEAKAAGAEDALLLSTEGRVACASAANLLIIDGDRLTTPPVSEGVLPGIMRALILDLAPACGFQPIEAPVTIDQMTNARAVLTTNSIRLVGEVVALDGHAIRRHAATATLRAQVAESIRRECGRPLPTAA